jgi:hypothetical protein
VIALMVVMLDERFDLLLKVAGCCDQELRRSHRSGA